MFGPHILCLISQVVYIWVYRTQRPRELEWGNGEYSGNDINQLMDYNHFEIKHFIMSFSIAITKYIRMCKINILNKIF